ncbi:MAG TPA: helix-turn-helix transcriptional regulator [Mycobacteriales bacterium]|nr:helix-turn-helix transcriptional regulator [Mycobacteriales bacterium]
MPPGRAVSEAHARLGRALRATRDKAGISTRQVPRPGPGPADRPYYSSGHISLVEAGSTAPSPELIEAYAAMPGGSRAELRSLYEQMLTTTREAARRRRQGEVSVPARPPRDLTEVGDRTDVQEHYFVVSTEVEHRFGPGGAITEVVTTIGLRARRPGVLLYYTGFSYPADLRPGVLRIEAVSGATVLATEESISGALACYLRLDREVGPDDPEPHLLTYRVRVDSEQRAAPRLRGFAFEGREQLLLRAVFDPAADPGSVWWFAVADIVDAEHPAPGNTIRGGPGGVYERHFERLVPGWCYGFGWSW